MKYYLMWPMLVPALAFCDECCEEEVEKRPQTIEVEGTITEVDGTFGGDIYDSEYNSNAR